MSTNLTIFVMLMQLASINGQVHEARTHKALAMVRIELLEQGIPSAMDYSDAEGRFRFTNLLPGSYTISADAMGYTPTLVEIDPTMPFPVDVELTRTKLKRQDVSALNARGNRYRRLGQLEKAEACFKSAFQESNSVYIALNLAEVYTAQQRFEDAKAVLTVAARRAPESGDAYYGLALVYFKQERFEEAENAALQAHRRPHRVADVHLLLAKIYARKAPESVRTQLELYLEEAPNGVESDRVRAIVK
jgi:tetratricopeptide (TPR) repeat protein